MQVEMDIICLGDCIIRLKMVSDERLYKLNGNSFILLLWLNNCMFEKAGV